MPSEIREKILKNVVGENLIHIRYIDPRKLVDDLHRAEMARLVFGSSSDDIGGDSSDSEDTSYDSKLDSKANTLSSYVSLGGLGHNICVSSPSERSLYEQAVSSSITVPDGESIDHYMPSCKERHGVCRNTKQDLQEGPSLRIDLRVLGASRQLYEEANYLLWTTNMFSFDDPCTFKNFLTSLNPAQKRHLTYLHFNAIFLRSYENNKDWSKALKVSHLKMLRNIQYLHLCFELPRNHGDYFCWWLSLPPKQMTIEDTFEHGLEPFLRFRVIAKRFGVTVIVSDVDIDSGDIITTGSKSPRLTTTEKLQFAESFRARLMDPRGIEVMDADAAVTKTNRLKKSMLDARNDRRKSWRRAKYLEAKMDGARTEARRTASRVEVMRHLAQQKGAHGHESAHEEDARVWFLKIAKEAELKARYTEQWAKKGRARAAEKAAKFKRAIARWEQHEAKSGE